MPDPDPDGLAVLLAVGAPRVAWRLLGSVFSHAGVSIRLTEVEAYAGADDPASHACRGPTPRNAVMFGPPARLYVYFSYGMHHAANLVCGPVGAPSAVLLRAGEVVAGHGLAHQRRPAVTPLDSARLARGPGNLARALGLTRPDDGAVLGGEGGAEDGDGFAWEPAQGRIGTVGFGPRVGVSRAADRPWRWWLNGEPSVSAYRRSPRADPPAGSLD